YPQDIINNRFVYADRMQYSSANLGGVQFPVRLGDLANLDDGLVGYLIESAGSKPYSTIYSPAAPAAGANNVVQPTPTTTQITFSAAPSLLPLLIDPRAGFHATTGVLTVDELDISPDQYSQAMRNLAMTFFTNPVLQERQGLVVPLPQEQGFSWSWINPGTGPQIQLQSNAANDNAIWDYTPQMLLEGWLQLGAVAVKPGRSSEREIMANTINLSVLNPDAQPPAAVVYVDVTATLNVTLQNLTGSALTLNSQSNPSQFEIFMPTFYTAAEVQAMSISFADWEFSYNPNDISLMLTFNGPDGTQWADGGNITFSIT